MAALQSTETDSRLGDPQWTPRQREVLDLIARDLTNPEIAERLGITLGGAKWHVSEVLSKLGVGSREEAAEYWRAQCGLRPRITRGLRSLIPGFTWLKVGAGVAVAAGASLTVAVAMVALHDSGTSPLATVPSVGGQAMQAATGAQPIVAAAVTGPPCTTGLVIGSQERVENGAVILDVQVTKPRACELDGPIDVVVVRPGDGPDGQPIASRSSPLGQPIASQSSPLLAPAGTDRVLVSAIWRNWCAATPTPSTASPSNGVDPVVLPPVWVTLPAGGSVGSKGSYPSCTAPGSPTTLDITVATEPNPPAAAVTSTPAPAVTSAVDVGPFAQWFAAVVGARNEAALESISQPINVICPGTASPSSAQPSPLCQSETVGASVSAYMMDQNGNLGTPLTFFGQLSVRTDSSGPLVAAGCATSARNCERFVLAFDAIFGRGIGTYIAYTFEVIDGRAVLRGAYPGGGDRDVVLAGGPAQTPWGQVVFVPLTP